MPTDQLDLIEVLPENVKKIRALIRKRDEHHDKHIDHNKKAKELDVQIWDQVQAAGGKLDATGKLTIKLSEDENLEVARGEARLSCKVKSIKKGKDDEGEKENDDAGDDDGKAPPEAPTRRPRS